MGMFDMTMSEEQTAEFRTMINDAVCNRTNGEQVIAAGAMRRGGASGSYMASKAGGGLAYAAVSLARKKKAGGLPQQVLLALTPDNLYAFKLKLRGRGYQAKEEVAVWQRAGLRVSSSLKMGLTNVTIESPVEGEKVTLVPIGVKDDAVNLELIQMLETAHPSPTAS